MVAYHKPKNLKDIVMPSRMEYCKERNLRASAYIENQTGNVPGVSVKDRVKDIVLDDGVSSGMRERLNKTFNLVGQDVHYNSYKKLFVLKVRK